MQRLLPVRPAGAQPWLRQRRDEALALQPGVVKQHTCPLCRPRHPVCTSPTPRGTQDEDISMVTVHMLATHNVWASNHDIGGRYSRDVKRLEVLEHPPTPPASPPLHPARWQTPAGENPTNWVPEHEPYDTVPPSSLPLLSELLRSWGPSPITIENYRAITLPLIARLPFAFTWLVGDAE